MGSKTAFKLKKGEKILAYYTTYHILIKLNQLGSEDNNVNNNFKWNDNWWEKAFNSAMKSFSDKKPSKRIRKTSTSTEITQAEHNNFKVLQKKIAKQKKEL